MSVDEVVVQWKTLEQLWKKMPELSRYHTDESLYMMSINNFLQWWVVMDDRGMVTLAVITKVEKFFTGSVLQLLGVSGKFLRKSMPMMGAALEQFARENDCLACEAFIARPGWLKVLPSYGFVHTTTTLRKELPPTGVH